HGLFKGLLFLAAGDIAGAVGSQKIERLVSERARIPRAARWALLIGMLGIIGLPPLAGFAAKALLFAAGLPLPLELVLMATSLGTAFSFARLIPLLGGFRGSSDAESHPISYALLAAPILGLAPFLRLGLPSVGWHDIFEWRLVLESVAAIGLGVLLYRVARHRVVALPKRIFRLEEGLLTVLIGFFLIYLLSRLG
ncbi:hypothetical protein KJ567_01040, partial [Candidatus Bipolaricaulota bacterium]|nr:hypothetical protein [Candidatus Bipolaricaulota bacterium]